MNAWWRRIIAAGVAAHLTVACATVSNESGLSTTAPSFVATSVAGDPPSTPGPVTTTNVGDDPSTTLEMTSTTRVSIDYELRDGRVTGPERFEYQKADLVEIWVLVDVADVLHVHGYDVFLNLEESVPAKLRFVAEVPGVFEVELERGHHHLFEIVVSG